MLSYASAFIIEAALPCIEQYAFHASTLQVLEGNQPGECKEIELLFSSPVSHPVKTLKCFTVNLSHVVIARTKPI